MSLKKPLSARFVSIWAFFCGTVFLQAEFCCDIMKKTRNKAIDEEIKSFPIFPNLSHAQNMKYFVQIESRGLPSGGVVGAKPQGLKGGKNMEVLKFSEMRLKKDKVVFQLPIHKIRSNPYQPRKYFNRTALEELADSIRAYGHFAADYRP